MRGILIGIVCFALLIGGIFMWKANEKVPDPVKAEVLTKFRQDELMQLSEDRLKSLEGETLAVTGIVLSSEGDESGHTVTLGQDEMNIIICQADNRHLATMNKLSKGHFVQIVGTFAGHDFDEMMGRTIQMKNCVTGNLNN
jgi:hypothetical protein